MPDKFDLSRPINKLVQHGFSHLQRIEQRREFVDYLVKLKSNDYADKQWYISFKKYKKTVARFVGKLKEAYLTS